MEICGTVISGKKRGRTIGYPTMNIALSDALQGAVVAGTYAGSVFVEGERKLCAVFIPEDCSLIEGHIIDFDGDLYGQHHCIRIGQRLRDNKRFENVESLKAQITEDINSIKNQK